MNQVIINNEVIIIDIFITPKDDSIIIMGLSNVFSNKLGIDLEKVDFYVDDCKADIEYITVKNSRYFKEINNNILNEFNKHIFIGKIINPGKIINFEILNKEYKFTIQPKITDFCNKRCLTTIFKNDYYLIEEWSNYYYKLGFEHIFLYDNDYGKNNYYIDSNITVLNANWKYSRDLSGINYYIGQTLQQNHTIWKYNPNILGLLDLDEFIVPKNVNIFDETFYKDYCGISISSYFFGCNNKNIKNNIICNYFLREINDNGFHRRKCIINSNYIDIFCVHIPLEFKKDILYLDSKNIQMNHYYLLSGTRKNCDCKKYCRVYDDTILKLL
jgi:uncharacterized protein YuzE